MNTPIDMNRLFQQSIAIAIKYDNSVVEECKDDYEGEHETIIEYINNTISHFNDNCAKIVNEKLINLLTSWAITNHQTDIIKYLMNQDNFDKKDAFRTANVELVYAIEDGRETDEIEKIMKLLEE